MTQAEDETVYRSRWEICDDCECVTLIERDDDRGVPDDADWEEFGRCMVCGGSLRFGNADQTTVADAYWAKGKRAGEHFALLAMAKDFKDIDMSEAAALCAEAAAAVIA